VKSVLRDQDAGGEEHLLELLMERAVTDGADGGERRKESGRLLVGVALLVVDKAARQGREGAQRIAELIGRVHDALFVKRDRDRAPPASSSSSTSWSGSPHPVMVDLLAQLNAFLFASPVFGAERTEDDARVFVPVDVLRRATTNAAHGDEETKHQQFQLLSGSVLHASRLLSSGDDAKRESDGAARYGLECLDFVAENIPLVVSVRRLTPRTSRYMCWGR
jgi:hypothetical protein